MKELNQNLKNIRNFFSLIYYQKSATREEIYNFLQECLKFVFEENNLDINDYKIIFHFVKFKEKTRNASVVPEDNNDYTFHVKIKKQALTYNEINFDLETANEKMGDLLEIVLSAFHEYAHIIQYINNLDDMLKFDYKWLTVEETIDSFEGSKNKNVKRISKELTNYLDAQEFISKVEKDATTQAHRYYRKMLDLLIIHEQDEELANFFASIYVFVNSLRKDDFKEYRKQNSREKQIVSTLKAYGIDESVYALD
ncbi:MAG: hypothetical protein IJ415_03120 [Clostridia bacterium]|nr:hypothetical protein [Clostridia bacterium]